MTEGTKQQHTTNKEIKKYKIKHKTVSVKNYSAVFSLKIHAITNFSSQIISYTLTKNLALRASGGQTSDGGAWPPSPSRPSPLNRSWACENDSQHDRTDTVLTRVCRSLRAAIERHVLANHAHTKCLEQVRARVRGRSVLRP